MEIWELKNTVTEIQKKKNEWQVLKNKLTTAKI